MEKELIIKGLECCIAGDVEKCEKCPRHHSSALTDAECMEGLSLDALALIKELTIELDAMRGAANSYKMHNERLTEENERLKAEVSVKKKLLDKCVDLEDRVRADTVREFAERLKKECLVDSGYEVLQIGTIDRIAEEMLGKECTSCKHFVGCEPSTLGGCDLYEEDEEK